MKTDIFFDTHCHLHHEDFAADRKEMIARAVAAGFRMLTIGTSLASSKASLALASAHENLYAAVGIHPSDVNNAPDETLQAIRVMANSARESCETGSKLLAIGETGLDFMRGDDNRARQIDFLRQHLDLALELDLPVILHARKSGAEVLDIIEPFVAAGGRAVWHCFTAPKRDIEEFVTRGSKLGLYFGIGGILTFADGAPLRRVLKKIPENRLLLETDSPYLSPLPREDRRNEPAHALRTATRLATERGVTLADIGRITTRNACRFFKLPLPLTIQQADSAIAYVIRNSMYLSLTNACNAECTFCARGKDFIVKGHDLELTRDPETAAVLAAMGDVSPYEEVVFCGYGEPTMRLETLKDVAKEIKARGKFVRVNTNGYGSWDQGRDIVPELVGLVDAVCVSLNSADPAQYLKIMRPAPGEAAYGAMCEFVRACVAAGIDTTCTAVSLPGVDMAAAEAKATELGAKFRARTFQEVG